MLRHQRIQFVKTWISSYWWAIKRPKRPSKSKTQLFNSKTHTLKESSFILFWGQINKENFESWRISTSLSELVSNFWQNNIWSISISIKILLSITCCGINSKIFIVNLRWIFWRIEWKLNFSNIKLKFL